MSIPNSGPIKFSDLRDEFGGSNPVKLSDYYRGGGLVPNIAANAGVPTSGAIKLSDFRGAMNVFFSTTMTRSGPGIVTGGRGYNSAEAMGSVADATIDANHHLNGVYTLPNGDLTVKIMTIDMGQTPPNELYFTTFICSLGTFQAINALTSTTGLERTWFWQGQSQFPTSGTEVIAFG